MKTRIRPAHVGRLRDGKSHCRVLVGLTIPRTLETIPVLIGVKYGLVGGIAAQEVQTR